jgi:hypothetical protein
MTPSSLCAKDVATDGRLSGLVSVDDVLLLLAAELAELSELIRRGQLREARRTEVTFDDEFAT